MRAEVIRVIIVTFTALHPASNASAQAVLKGANLTDQQRCADYAHTRFIRDEAEGDKKVASLGLKSAPGEIVTDFVSSHFNPTLNRCFMETSTQNVIVASDRIITTKEVYDAYESTSVGEYVWQTEKNKKYWEVNPKVCRVKLPGGEENSVTPSWNSMNWSTPT